MKVYFSGYRDHWISPYTIMEKIIFWRKIDYDEPLIDRCNKLLSPICEGIKKVLDIVHPHVKYVKIDKYDSWSLDSTLAPIIIPLLKQLRDNKHGAPCTNDDDVPEELKSTSAPAKENEWDTDDNWFKRWDWILNEMIWAFEQCENDDWESQYYTGTPDITWEKLEGGGSKMSKGPNYTLTWDKEGYMSHCQRITRGTTLFGKYYRNLWD